MYFLWVHRENHKTCWSWFEILFLKAHFISNYIYQIEESSCLCFVIACLDAGQKVKWWVYSLLAARWSSVAEQEQWLRVLVLLYSNINIFCIERGTSGEPGTALVYIAKSPSSPHPALRHPQNLFHQGLLNLNWENNGAFQREPLTPAAWLALLWFLCELDWLPREHILYLVRLLIKEAGAWFVKNVKNTFSLDCSIIQFLWAHFIEDSRWDKYQAVFR